MFGVRADTNKILATRCPETDAQSNFAKIMDMSLILCFMA